MELSGKHHAIVYPKPDGTPNYEFADELVRDKFVGYPKMYVDERQQIIIEEELESVWDLTKNGM